jgi:molecular chaperone DnaK
LNEKIEELKKKLENRDSLKAAEVKELVNSVQQQSLKLFEAAYKKMAAQNQQQQPPAEEASKTSSEEEGTKSSENTK